MLPLVADVGRVLLHPVDTLDLDAVEGEEHHLRDVRVDQEQDYDQRADELVDLCDEALFLDHADHLPEQKTDEKQDDWQ